MSEASPFAPITGTKGGSDDLDGRCEAPSQFLETNTGGIELPSRRSTRTAWRAFPLSLFTCVMGLASTGLAWREAGKVLSAAAVVGELILATAALVYVGLSAALGLRITYDRVGLAAELRHENEAPFAASVAIATMLIASALGPYAPLLSHGLWLCAVVVHLCVNALLVGQWLTGGYPGGPTPAWFIPLAGAVLAPVAGIPLGYWDLCWSIFGISIILWLMLTSVMLQRAASTQALAEAHWPSFAILVAPPAVGCLGYLELNQGVADAFARSLYAISAFFILVLIGIAHRLARQPFGMIWWSYTYPLSAFALASNKMSGRLRNLADVYLPEIAIALASGVVAIVIIRTLKLLSSPYSFRQLGWPEVIRLPAGVRLTRRIRRQRICR
ncbi:SLAC1 anion channel family protein [Methylorubrum extorquens]|uniref:C4-dicarboxylate transporter/malic acid transport protein n=1 Tax=Methylorubrum extorquens (strain CM4 / NCIMB 13688) TaxID=440085 RepID=B7L3M4_METC4|nr:SLAC1 anion channel family protein [Methylorubrum extorquens]ACK86432.1 C4-dicarboxylate transporter/malic acid transport protein [Methylorubrum extorquens CM4]